MRNIYAFVGEFSQELSENSFDILFSVSVVEHVPDNNIADFITDCHRILKPGGQMIHLVDMYLGPDRVALNSVRAASYRSAFDSGLFEPAAEILVRSENDLEFKETYCTNPDNMMYKWNEVAPSLRSVREGTQSVSLSWIGRKSIS